MFFAANAGAPLGRSGKDRSNVVWRLSVDEAVKIAGNAVLDAEGDYVGGNVTLVEVPNAGNVLENVNGGESDLSATQLV